MDSGGGILTRRSAPRTLVHQAMQHLLVTIYAQGESAITNIRDFLDGDVQAIGMRSPISAMAVL